MPKENNTQQTSPGSVVNTSGSKQSQLVHGTYNYFLDDTQKIAPTIPDSLSLGHDSQPSKVQNIRILNEHEDNRIIDSSCDFKDSISTQELLRKEPDTVIIKEDTAPADRNGDESIRFSGSNSSAPFKNLKLPDGESPWLRKTNPSQDFETPWLNKIKDPFKETPIGETPDSTRKMDEDNSLNTPSVAHKVFQQLRERENQKALEFDSLTVPELFKNTQPPSLERSQDRDDETTRLNNDAADDDTNEVNITTKDPSSQWLPTQEIKGTLVIEDQNHNDEAQDPKSDNTLADIQVPGTAPEPDNLLNQEDRETQSNQDNSIQDKEKESSPINSDDEADFSIDTGKIVQNEQYSTGFNILPEDSLQKHRDLYKKNHNPQIELARHSKSVTDDTQRISQGKRTKSFPARLDDDTARYTQESQGNTQLKQDLAKSTNKSQPKNDHTSSLKVEESSPAIREKADTFELNGVHNSNEEINSQPIRFGNDVAQNTTQEVSEYEEEDNNENNTDEDNYGDEDRHEHDGENDNNEEEEKVDNTVEEFDDTRLREGWSTKSSNPVNGSTRSGKGNNKSRKNNKQLNVSSTPDESFNQYDITAALEANTSQMDISDEHTVISGIHDDILTPAFIKEFPSEILRAETHDLTENDISFKDSVWYLENTRYYPGIIVNQGEKGLLVKFHTQITEVTGGIFPLDIQIGDIVKFLRNSYIVTGLECVDQNDDGIRCMRGYDTLIVKKTKGRGKSRKILDGEERFTLAEVHIENEEWHRRPRVLNEMNSRLSLSQVQPSKRALKTYKDELVLSTPKKPKYVPNGIFNECIFVITGDVDKERLTKLIITNGGTVLEDGFASMIHFKNDVASSEEFKDFRFGALIAEKYLRSPKYLETVALGWPLLSQRFIYECVAENKFIELSPFLLPSGESSELGGNIKCPDLFPFLQNWISGNDLSSQLENNKILEDMNIFICSKKNFEITEFLFKILGANNVVFISITNYTNLINTVIENATSDKQSLIYHDKISAIKSILDLKPNDGKKRRSKKGLILSEVLINKQRVELELVDWEWLVQCVISSRPWKSQHKWVSN